MSLKKTDLNITESSVKGCNSCKSYKIVKYIVVVAFLLLPFLGFFLGIRYEKLANQRQISHQTQRGQNIPTPSPTLATILNQVEPDPRVKSNEELLGRKMVSAADVYYGKLSKDESDLLSNFFWPALKSAAKDDQFSEVYLVDCAVTNTAPWFDLSVNVAEVPNNQEDYNYALNLLLQRHMGGFPAQAEISMYENASNGSFKHADSGVNGTHLSKQGELAINFFDSVAAYGGGSARVGCMHQAVDYTMRQFSEISTTKMCIEKYDDCEFDFQP